MGDMNSDELITQRILDRLVDGELDETERRTVLNALERQPETWRACAIAFLEHQALADSVPNMVTAASDGGDIGLSRNDRIRWTGLLALAATAFFAFVLGLQSDGWLRTRDVGPAIVESASESQPKATAVKPEPYLVNNQAGGASAFSLEDFLTRESIIPSQLLQDLEQSGNLVQKHRGLVPMLRPDGTQVLVPYEELEITPVKHMTH